MDPPLPIPPSPCVLDLAPWFPYWRTCDAEGVSAKAVPLQHRLEVMLDIPKDKSYPRHAVQCDGCGGHGCGVCENKGWLPCNHVRGRRCANPNCSRYLEPDRVPVYCSNQCAMDDA